MSADRTDLPEPTGQEIAIVGMSGRFPGARDVPSFWRNLYDGVDSIARFSERELLAAGVPADLVADPRYVRAGSVLDGVDMFAAGFFGYPPTEARIMDPQQRLFLEQCWSTLEDAGHHPSGFDGSIGVFGGSAISTYLLNNLMRRPDVLGMVGETAAGLANDKDSLATRVNHVLDLTGPAFAIQSYCSTSLVAVCVAATALVNAECDLALAGGVSVQVPHRVGYLYQDGGMTSPDGRCRAFDEAAAGTPVGSGVAVVALRRLEDALADGDQIYAVIRGWAVGNDGGHKVGFTAPGVRGQAAVVAEALAAAGLTPYDIDYVEAHGTGTPLGDAAELSALRQVFPDDARCAIGSVKTNVGHLDRAAGATGLIKTALALRHGVIPATLNFRRPHPHLRLGDNLEVVAERRPWPRGERIRRAGVSAFGIGGTNAHVVLEEAPDRDRSAAGPPRPYQILTCSARTAEAADTTLSEVRRTLAERPDIDPADAAFTLHTGRRLFEHRRAVLVPGTGAVDSGPGAVEIGPGAVDTGRGTVWSGSVTSVDRRLGLLIGTHTWREGGGPAGLYASEPEFRAVVDEARAVLREAHGTDLGSAFATGHPGPLPATVTEPAAFVLAYATAELLRTWGVRPALVAAAGHGELVAASLAGILDWRVALRLVATRAELASRAAPSSPAGRAAVEAEACGSAGGLADEAAGELAVGSADELVEWAREHVRAGEIGTGYVSSVTGAPLRADDAADPAYWGRRIFTPTRVADAVGALRREPDLLVVGLGAAAGPPCDVDLLPAATNDTAGTNGTAGTGGTETWALAAGLAQLWLAGVPIDWAAYHRGRSPRRASLPGHPLERRSYWIDPPEHQPNVRPAAVPTAASPTTASRTATGPAATDPAAASPTTASSTAASPAATDPATVGPAASEPGASVYEATWSPAPDEGADRPPGRVLLLTDGTGVGRAVERHLRGLGVAVTAVACAEAFSDGPDGRVADADLFGQEGRDEAPQVVAYLGGIDGAGTSTEAEAAFDDLCAVGRALGRQAGDIQLIVVTAGAQAAGDAEVPAAGQAMLHGAGLVIGQEYPHVSYRNVDLPPLPASPGPGWLGTVAGLLAGELRLPDPDDIVAYRDGVRLLRTFAPADGLPALTGTKLPGLAGTQFPGLTGTGLPGAHGTGVAGVAGEEPAGGGGPRPGGAYLITGGLGTVGLLLAERLARVPDVHLVLTGRRDLPPASRWPETIAAGPDGPEAEALRVLGRLADRGVDVTVERVDVTDLAAMRAVKGRIIERHGRLAGVVHAAGVTGPDTFLAVRDLDRAAARRHFAAKVDGTLVIEDLMADQDSDFCVLFSSISSVLGGIGFASYAAANIFLDAVARRHRHDRTAWTAINWDTWAPTATALRGGLGATMAKNSLPVPVALAAFELLVTAGRPSVLVAAHDVGERLREWRSGREAAPHGAAADRPTFARGDLAQEYVPPLGDLQRRMAGLWAELIGIDRVGMRDNLFDLGGNSLLGLQLLNRVRDEFGVTIPAVALFEAPTPGALCDRLQRASCPPPVAAAPVAAVPVAAVPVAAVPVAAAPVAAAPVADVPVAAEPVADEPATSESVTTAPLTTVPLTTAPVTTAPRTTAVVPATAPGTDGQIAIIGMAGRFPGAADVDALWHNLVGGVESITRFSDAELLASGEDPRLIADPAYVPARPVLDDVRSFDAGFFGFSPREATLADPQQRIFLECAWEALEQAGYVDPGPATRVGVYGGTNLSTYLLSILDRVRADDGVDDFEAIIGNDKDALTTTVSYKLNLTGPSVAVQTFCSTSLVAVHLAVQSLRRGECELALAGGVSIRVPDRVGHLYRPGGMLTPDGHVRTFDAAARGAIFGDAAAVVLLKPLSAAMADRDTVLAVIRGSAMNNDGSQKVGYTAPSVAGQAAVVADALRDAGVDPRDIDYVEAHGTATELGDPIEVAALAQAFGPDRREGRCAIGSIKTNVGHLDRAAGTTGVIKVVQALRHGLLPATLHYQAPNPKIDFAGGPFAVVAGNTPWPPRPDRPRLASVNSLGMGGTNVHLVVQEAPERAGGTPPPGGRRYQVLPVSARSAGAVEHAARNLAEHLRGDACQQLSDVAFTLQAGRRRFPHRVAVIADGLPAASAGLLAEGQAATRLRATDSVQGRPVAFLFAGVGEQYPGMLSDLYAREPQFRAVVDECCALLGDGLGDDVRDQLTHRDSAGPASGGGDLAALMGRGAAPADAGPPAGTATELAQPTVFVAGYALARTLMGWGIRPTAMFGYSLGEYVAACLSGVLSLPDALRLVAHRARLIAALPAGAMLAVATGEEQLVAAFGPLADRDVDLAIATGSQAVIGGSPAAVRRFATELRDAGHVCQELSTTHAFHTRTLLPASAELTAWISENITLNPPSTPYISDVTGELATAELVTEPGYWARHMCQPVRFGTGLGTLLADPDLAVLELGAGHSLGALVRAHPSCERDRWPRVVASLPGAAERRPDDAVLTEALARLWLAGVDVDWPAYHRGGGYVPGRVPLPTYPFQREEYWLAANAPAAGRRPAIGSAEPDGAGHNLVDGAGHDLAEGAGHAPGWDRHTDLDHRTGSAGPADLTNGDPLRALSALPRLPEERWLYRQVWREGVGRSRTAGRPAGALPRRWLVYTAEGAPDLVVRALLDHLDAAELTLVRPGRSLSFDGNQVTIRPGNLDDARALLLHLRDKGRLPSRVVHLWNLPGAGRGRAVRANRAAGTVGAGRLRSAVRHGLDSLVVLARAAGETGLRDWALDVVVAGTQRVSGTEPLDPAAATAIGASRLIPLEYPGVSSRLIDLPADGIGTVLLGNLAAELLSEPLDALVALRDWRRWAPAYLPVEAAGPAEADGPAEAGGGIRQRGSFLITGGLGGIGLAMAERLAEDYKARLVLFSRTGLPDPREWPAMLGRPDVPAAVRRRIKRLQRLRDAGTDLHVVAGDVARPECAAEAVRVALDRFGELHGVLHTAGVPASGLMQFKEPAELAPVLAPKVAGTVALGQALAGHPLDFVALFSSITSITGGGPGQVDYCAANAFLDTYAAARQDLAARVVSIGWGEWRWNAWDSGLGGYDADLREFFTRHRARFGIAFAEGWRALQRALADPAPHVIVSTQDFREVVRLSRHHSVGGLAGVSARREAAGDRHARPDLSVEFVAPRTPTEGALADLWAEALRLEAVGVDDNFFELGGNSLLATQILARTRQELGATVEQLPPHILFEAPTLGELALVIDSSGERDAEQG